MKEWEAAYFAGIIDGEGSITLTKLHSNEFRRPVITISSTDLELLIYLKELTNGYLYNKKNYKPGIHKNSYILNIKNKNDVFNVLRETHKFLRVDKKRRRANYILENYDLVTPRNGKYS